MKIRKARLGDEKDIANVVVSTWKVAYKDILPDEFLKSLTTERHEKILREHIEKQTETVLVLEDDDERIVGMISGGKDRSGLYDCEVVAIYIIPEHQKKGYGKELFKALIREYKKNSYKTMIVWAFKENKDQKFYEKLGGTIKQQKVEALWGIEKTIVGYVWADINTIV